MFYTDSSSSSSDSESTRYINCTCDVTTRDIDSPRPGYLTYYLDTSATSNTSQSSSEGISQSEMRKLKDEIHCANGLVMNKTGNLYHGYRGELQLSIYRNYGMLTVHIQKGVRFRHDTAVGSVTYTEVSLHPSSETNAMCMTEAVESVNNPVFNEKFSFELMAGDEDKRVLISIFHRAQSEMSSKLIGCMSFGVKRLYEQSVSGWFYLLAENIGRLKHRRVCHQLNSIVRKRNTHRQRKGTVPASNSAANSNHVIIIDGSSDNSKGLVSGGRGFSVSGERPTFVARVQTGSAADKSGLQTGDKILRVNGFDVSGCTSDALVRLIRSTTGDVQLRLEVKRTVNESQQGLHCQVPIETSSPRYVENVVETSCSKSTRRQSSCAHCKTNTSCDPIQKAFSQSLKVSKKVRNKSSLQIRSSRTWRSRWTSSREVVSQAQDSVVIDELEKSPRRMPPSRVQTLIPSIRQSPSLVSNRLVDENIDAEVRNPLLNASECSHISATLEPEQNQLYEMSKSQRLSSTNQMLSDRVNMSNQLSDASQIGIEQNVKTVAHVIADVKNTDCIQQSSTNCNADTYTSSTRHHRTFRRPLTEDTESHYVDMAVYRNQIKQPTLLPEKDKEILRVAPSASTTGLYESWIRRQDGVTTLKAPSEERRTSCTYKEDCDYVRYNCSTTPVQHHQTAAVTTSNFTNISGSDYVQINMNNTAAGTHFISGSHLDQHDIDPFGLVPLEGAPSIYSAFYAHSTPLSTPRVGYDALTSCPEQRQENNKKATTSYVEVPVHLHVDLMRSSKIKKTTRNAIKEFLSENLGKFL